MTWYEDGLSEPAAWRLIAKRIATGRWRRKGLCAEIAYLETRRAQPRISGVTAQRMVQRVRRHHRRDRHSENGWYVFPMGNGRLRILAALFLGLEAESEIDPCKGLAHD